MFRTRALTLIPNADLTRILSLTCLVAVDEGHVAVIATECVQTPLIQLQLREAVLVARACGRATTFAVSICTLPA